MRAPERTACLVCGDDLHPWSAALGLARPASGGEPVYAFAVPFVWLANAGQREHGLHLRISDVQRIPPASVDPTAKNYHWNDLTMGLLGALDAGADSVVLVDAQGHVVEGPGFNVFCVKDGAVITPDRGMLEGISRRTAIEMARSLGMEVQICPVPAGTLRAADEVFITTSGGGVLPVTQVDAVAVGDGKPGRVTRQLVETYWAWHALPQYSQAIAY